VGMLNRDLNEDNVKGLFIPYGTVEEVSVLRDGDGRSKGSHRLVTLPKANILISPPPLSTTPAWCGF